MTAPVVHINRPDEFLPRRIVFCPVEQRRRRMAGRDAAWYGATWTCCGCGDSWTDGEMHPRPFKRAWRKEAVAAAKRMWLEAAGFNPAEHTAWVREQLGVTA
ncbi:hypothetical protein [Micromonospora sediminicola]|uniref:hypothetical protein n=1 Tax=Micromonospora sediminicola TaxID=946078 RepID=UPI0037B2416B